MRSLCCVLLLFLPLCASADEAADRAAIRKTIATFNDHSARASVVLPGADLPDLSRCYRPEVSQIYFEVKSIRFVTADVALVDATANQYGTMILKNAVAASFVVKREAGEWKIDALRVFQNCVVVVPL